MNIFKLPDLGEGLPDAEIVEWHVKVGDTVALDQPLVSMETAKAVVEVPSPYSGEIKVLHGNAGDVIKTGASLVSFDGEVSGRQDTGTVAGDIEIGDEIVASVTAPVQTGQAIHQAVKASPTVRALARQLQINLLQIHPTGPKKNITKQDVLSAAEAVTQTPGSLIKGEPLRGVRRQMAKAMIASHQSVVPVTVFDEAIITDWYGKDDITVRLCQAIVAAVKIEPSLNAFFEGRGLQKQLVDDIHLGLAMDTPDGLFVPVIQSLADLSGDEIRGQIEAYKHSVINRSVDGKDLRGATMTLSNFGKFAGLYANPIIVPPQVAIIAAGRIHEGVRVNSGQSTVARILPISLSFDHRAITGGEATRFMGALLSALSD